MSASVRSRLRIAVRFDAYAGWAWELRNQGRPIAQSAGGFESIQSATRAADTLKAIIGRSIPIEVERKAPLASKQIHPWSAALRRPAAGLPVYPAEASEKFEEEEAEEQPADR